MTSLTLRKLALAVALAAALPSAALAKPCDDDRFPPPRPAPADWGRDGGPDWGRDGRDWRHESPREREAREIRRELRELEDTRADFYARFGGRPGKVRRFERWYAERRAELDARWDALRTYAWR
ncbi:hypothetical protein [Anaeromyxobacter terrae]|uniref:hypothetical protein n=1 Tax=Anaeromyxobacter terrae TaxID=2925406 RepID=UPI001F562727|nr:hypothetical protein [Anaeromyxobacter sp. SG22]